MHKNTAATNFFLFAGRIMLVVALLPNGLRKIQAFHEIALGIGGVPQMIHGKVFPAVHPLFYLPFPQLSLALSVLFDIGGSLLIIIGLQTRGAGFLMAGYSAVCTLIFHYDVSIPENLMAVMRNLSLIGGLTLVAGCGAGDWSLDAVLRSRNQPVPPTAAA